MNSVINKKPKPLANVYAAFAYRSVHYTFIVQLHLYNETKTIPKIYIPTISAFLCLDVFKTSKSLLSKGLLEFS